MLEYTRRCNPADPADIGRELDEELSKDSPFIPEVIHIDLRPAERGYILGQKARTTAMLDAVRQRLANVSALLVRTAPAVMDTLLANLQDNVVGKMKTGYCEVRPTTNLQRFPRGADFPCVPIHDERKDPNPCMIPYE